MPSKDYRIWLSEGAYIAVELLMIRGRVVSFVVRLMIAERDREVNVARYDTAHGAIRQKLRHEGATLARRKAVLDALEIRFGQVPGSLRETINAIHDESRLRALHQTAIQAASLEDFVRTL